MKRMVSPVKWCIGTGCFQPQDSFSLLRETTPPSLSTSEMISCLLYEILGGLRRKVPCLFLASRAHLTLNPQTLGLESSDAKNLERAGWRPPTVASCGVAPSIQNHRHFPFFHFSKPVSPGLSLCDVSISNIFFPACVLTGVCFYCSRPKGPKWS